MHDVGFMQVCLGQIWQCSCCEPCGILCPAAAVKSMMWHDAGSFGPNICCAAAVSHVVCCALLHHSRALLATHLLPVCEVSAAIQILLILPAGQGTQPVPSIWQRGFVDNRWAGQSQRLAAHGTPSVNWPAPGCMPSGQELSTQLAYACPRNIMSLHAAAPMT